MSVLVVGGGILGVAIGHALAARGRAVTVLEARALGAGASGRSGGMVRAFHADPALADLAAESLPVWQASPAFRRTGSLYLAPAAQRAAVAAEVARLSARVRITLLEPAEARARFPQAVFADDELAIHEPDAGWVDVPAAVAGFAAGLDVREGVAATGVRGDGVETPTGFLPAEAVVLAAGVGSAALLAPHGLGAELYGKAIQVVRLEGRGGAEGGHPCYLDLATRAYGRAVDAETTWVGVACAEEPALDAPLDLPLDAAEAARAMALAVDRFPALAGRARTAGLRTVDAYTRGALGLVGPAPGVPGLFLATGFGGTGFKIAPAIAARVAAAVDQAVAR